MVFFSTVIEDDLKKFNSEYKTLIDSYALAANAIMLQIGQTYPNEIVEAIFDRTNGISSKLQLAGQYAKSDRRIDNMGVTDKIQPIPLNKGLSFKEVTPIQAADFFAWETRRYHIDLWGWIDDLTQKEQWRNHFKEWPRHKLGDISKSRRKSADELFCKSGNQGGIWDYQTLCRVHEARGGVW
jgi:hypothetical protein